MRVSLTEQELKTLTEGALWDIMKGYGNIVGGAIAGAKAVHADAKAGKPVSYNMAYNIGKAEYLKGGGTPMWKKQLKHSNCDAEIVQFILDEYNGLFYQQTNKSNIPARGHMVNYTNHGQVVQKKMSKGQRDVHDAMLKLKEWADQI